MLRHRKGIGTLTAKEIYDILRTGGLSRAGALGMLGNMAAESTINLKTNIVQIGCSKLSDEQYTAAVDNGLYDFADGIGYGLCQWTLKSRKRALLEYAKSYGVSVSDGVMQVDFALFELRKDFSDLFRFLCSTDDIDTASDRICDEFENPKINNFTTRRNYAHQFEAEIPETTATPYKPKDPIEATFPPDPTIKAFQLWMWNNGYWDADKINGHKSKEFFTALEQFVKDMQTC